MIGKLDDALRFHQTVLSLRAERQQIVASNIANADTPNYKARDIDFNAALKDALAGSQASGTAAGASGGLTQTNAAHIANGSLNPNQTATGTPLLYRATQQGSVDGNTVDMDTERNQFADNALRYEASITLIGSQIKNLLSAIQG